MLSWPEPKVEHHEGRGICSCPIFPELRPNPAAHRGHYSANLSLFLTGALTRNRCGHHRKDFIHSFHCDCCGVDWTSMLVDDYDGIGV